MTLHVAAEIGGPLLGQLVRAMSEANGLDEMRDLVCRGSAGLSGGDWSLLLAGEERLQVVASHGFDPAGEPPMATLAEWPAQVRVALLGGDPVYWAEPSSLGLPVGESGRGSAVLLVPVVGRGSEHRVLAVGGARCALETAEQAIVVLAAHAALTEEVLTARNEAPAVFEAVSEAVFVLDADATVRRGNGAAMRLLGTDAAGLAGAHVADLVVPADEWRLIEHLSADPDGMGVSGGLELHLRHAGGTLVEVDASTHRFGPDGEIEGYILTARDLRERKSLESELSHWALHDPLTNLANRSLLRQRLEQVTGDDRRPTSRCAVLLIDLDDFKGVNDSFGHDQGDRLLVAVGERLRHTARANDTVARLGGDEFVILMHEIASDGDAVGLGERVLAALEAPFSAGGTEVSVRASIGVRPGERGRINPNQLLRDADLAMYAAKDRGKAAVALYEPEMHTRVRQEQAVRSGLKQALECEEFTVYYQPVVDLRSGHLRGTEALVRWQHPTRGLLAPEAFIAVAESSSLIVDVGAWVLDEACRQTAAWNAGNADPIHVSVNVSPRQLADPGFVAVVARTLDRHRLDPRMVALEITESMVADRDAVSRAAISELDALGVRIQIDDFGIGYSALGYLGSLPIDAIKIDRSFVAGLDGRAEDAAVAKAICHIGRMLELTLVAEGIERPEQVARLLAHGCTLGQGFLYSPPVGPTEIEAMLAGQSTLVIPPDAAAGGAGSLISDQPPASVSWRSAARCAGGRSHGPRPRPLGREPNPQPSHRRPAPRPGRVGIGPEVPLPVHGISGRRGWRVRV